MKELTKAEEEIMQVLWDLEKGFVKDILEQLPEPKPAYNTVSTIVRILETKGFVIHKAYGKTHEYLPKISRETYRKFIMDGMVENYFNGSFNQLVSYFVREKNISLKDLDHLLKEMNRKPQKKNRK